MEKDFNPLAHVWNKKSRSLKDSNLKDKGSESLKRRSEDFGEKANEFESSTKWFKFLRRKLKQKIEKRKDSNPYNKIQIPNLGK